MQEWETKIVGARHLARRRREVGRGGCAGCRCDPTSGLLLVSIHLM